MEHFRKLLNQRFPRGKVNKSKPYLSLHYTFNNKRIKENYNDVANCIGKFYFIYGDGEGDNTRHFPQVYLHFGWNDNSIHILGDED